MPCPNVRGGGLLPEPDVHIPRCPVSLAIHVPLDARAWQVLENRVQDSDWGKASKVWPQANTNPDVTKASVAEEGSQKSSRSDPHVSPGLWRIVHMYLRSQPKLGSGVATMFLPLCSSGHQINITSRKPAFPLFMGLRMSVADCVITILSRTPPPPPEVSCGSPLFRV